MPFLHGLQSLISTGIPVQIQQILIPGVGDLNRGISRLRCLHRLQYHILGLCHILSSKTQRWGQGSMAGLILGFGHESPRVQPR